MAAVVIAANPAPSHPARAPVPHATAVVVAADAAIWLAATLTQQSTTAVSNRVINVYSCNR